MKRQDFYANKKLATLDEIILNCKNSLELINSFAFNASLDTFSLSDIDTFVFDEETICNYHAVMNSPIFQIQAINSLIVKVSAQFTKALCKLYIVKTIENRLTLQYLSNLNILKIKEGSKDDTNLKNSLKFWELSKLTSTLEQEISLAYHKIVDLGKLINRVGSPINFASPLNYAPKDKAIYERLKNLNEYLESRIKTITKK